VLSQPGLHVAICGVGTEGQMEDNIRTVQNFKKITPEEVADVRRRAIIGAGGQIGSGLEYWKKKV
jgi:predicted aldo/keto reductase-like oxidoreductase